MYRAALIISLLACISVSTFSQEKQKTNLEIFEETISAELEKFYYYPGVNRNEPFIFIINPEEKGGSNTKTESRTKFLNNIVKKTASANRLVFSIIEDEAKINSDSAYNLMVLQVLILETHYRGFKKNKFLGEKTISRNIIINLAVELKADRQQISIKDFIKHDISDEIAFDNYELFESPQYDFTHAEPPKVSSFERVIFPVILICVTAAATILFFTIRSK